MMDPDDIEIESIIRLGSQAEGEYNVVEEHGVTEEIEVDDDVEPDTNLSKPYIGMEFDTVDAAYNFYNAYALRLGFGIRKSLSHKSAKDGSVIDRNFVCNKSGFYTPKTNSDDRGKEVVRRGTTMVGCGAMIRVKVTPNNTWRVIHFVEEHINHELTSPTKVGEHRSHKKAHLDPMVRSLMTQFKEKGMRNRDVARAIEACVGHQKISSQHVHDHIRKDRRKNLGQNCHLLIKYLKEKQKTESDFYFDFDLDEDNTFQRVFWADKRSQMDYGKFNDVIIFDVTYRTNSLSLPFAPITGINHHRQSILLGCALLPDEKEDTFVWLFSQWLKCMGRRAPGAIITDQDPAIGNAIARVFPAIGNAIDHPQETEANVGCKEVSPQMYFNLQDLWNIVFKESCKSVDDYQDIHSFLSNKLEVFKSRNSDPSQVQQPNSLPSQSHDQIGSSMPLTEDNTCECIDNIILDPSEPVRTKGKRRANDRWLGGMEASQKAKEKKLRHCRECGEVGHNNRTCLVLKAKEAAAKEAASKGI